MIPSGRPPASHARNAPDGLEGLSNRAADADPGRVGDVLAIQVPPNGGVLNTVGRLGIDADDFAAFDIGADNEALAAILPGGSRFSRLYFIDLTSGDATDLGQIGRGEMIVGLAIQVGPCRFRLTAPHRSGAGEAAPSSSAPPRRVISGSRAAVPWPRGNEAVRRG